jgi:glycosyltransferase involved in cell wall biosynthesis
MALAYIGNKTSPSGGSVTTLETLTGLLETEGFTVYTASSRKNKLWRFIHMMQTVFRNRKILSMVLIDTYSTQNFYYAVLIAKLCRAFRLKYIPILHGGNLPYRLSENPKLCRSLFGKAYTNVAPSRYLLEAFREKGFKNLTYIPNIIELVKYPFRHRMHVQPKLLWVRSFAALYNPDLALEVLEALLKQGVDATLCMVGPDKDGSLARCKAYAQERNLPVTFTGKLEKDEWIALAASYDIFLNTTNIDNTPVSVIEAMALGLPVISTNVGGIPYLLEHDRNALLVLPNDRDAFVEQLIRLLNTPNLAGSLSQQGREMVSAFDWQQVKPLWLKLLRH